jgi:survival-of-motor-neuron-related-splicing factor 30
VEVALLSDPDSEELKKLKVDLEEVIELTKELIKAQVDEQKRTYVEPSSSLYGEPSGSGGSEGWQKPAKTQTPLKIWKVGDKCSAKWGEDGQYHDATIEHITDMGEVSVVFDAYQNRSQTTIKELKERKVRIEVFPSNNNK